MDEQLIQALLQDTGPQAAKLKRQQAIADGLRKQAMTPQQGQMISGRYVAPSPLSYIQQGLAGYQGGKMQGEIDAGTQGLADQQMAGRKAYLDSLMMGLRKQYPQPPGAVLPPDGMEDR